MEKTVKKVCLGTYLFVRLRDREFHLYIDEGGTFGHNRVVISERKLRTDKNAYPEDIRNYYFGKLRYESIIRHLQLYEKSSGVQVRIVNVFSDSLTKKQTVRSIRDNRFY